MDKVMIRGIPLFEEPPVTKEEALVPYGSPNGAWARDGFDGGSELPDDLDIDRMIYPRMMPPHEQQAAQAAHERQEKICEIQHEVHRRSRDFSITERNVTGEDPGPPDPFKPDIGGEKEED